MSLSNKKFDIDLQYGQVAENLVESLITGKLKVEVKRDRMSEKTGNIAIEFECRGAPSGIKATTAEWWALDLPHLETVVMIKTSRLVSLMRQKIKSKEAEIKTGGDDAASKMVILKISDLLDPPKP